MIDFDELEILEPIIRYHKIKYSLLKDMVETSGMEGNKMNIFINLDSIFNLLYNKKMVPAINSLKGLENISLASELINMIAHYRHFFWNRYGVPTKFYLYRCNRRPKSHKLFNEDYMKTFESNRLKENDLFDEVNKIIELNLNLIKLISSYVQDAYYIESKGLEQGLIPYHLIKQYEDDNEVCNWIITSDKLEYQLTNLKNTFIIRAMGKKSKIIKNQDIYNHYYKNVKYRPGVEISPSLYSLVLSMVGYKDRNVKGSISFVKSMKIIDNMIFNKEIKNRKLPFINEDLFKYHIKDSDIINSIINNFKTIDFSYQNDLMSKKDFFKIEDQLVDKYDNKSIMKINNDYFQLNNLQLIELCEGIGVWK